MSKQSNNHKGKEVVMVRDSKGNLVEQAPVGKSQHHFNREQAKLRRTGGLREELGFSRERHGGFGGGGGWESGIETVTACGKCAKDKPTVAVGYQMYNNIIAMCRKMGHSEWLAYLIGHELPEHDMYVVTGLSVPEQTVTAGSVEHIADCTEEGVIGTVHSHGNMGAFFSKTDTDHIGANHPVMIVVSNARKTKQQIRKLLPCGAYIFAEAELAVVDPENEDATEFVNAALKSIKRGVVRQYQAPLKPAGEGIDRDAAVRANARANHGRAMRGRYDGFHTGLYANIGGQVFEVDESGTPLDFSRANPEFTQEEITELYQRYYHQNEVEIFSDEQEEEEGVFSSAVDD